MARRPDPAQPGLDFTDTHAADAAQTTIYDFTQED